MKKQILKISSFCIIFFAITLCSCQRNNALVGTNWVADVIKVDTEGDNYTFHYKLNFINNTKCSLEIWGTYDQFIDDFVNMPDYYFFYTNEFTYALSDFILIDNKYKGTINGNQIVFEGEFNLYDIYGLTFTKE